MKAARTDADVLIFDLEDAVAPESKTLARETVCTALNDPLVKARNVVVRVNALGSPWCELDVAAIARHQPMAVLFPKINQVADVELAEAMMSFYGIPSQTSLWCMIESPQAILNAREIGRLAGRPNGRMSAWVLGTNDLVKDLRARSSPMREGLLPILVTAVLAARANGLRILDGVHNDMADTVGFEATCEQGRQLGFDGRTLIHPAQIAPCHRAYSPSDHEVEDARAVVEAFSRPENQGKGVLRVNGRMVELLHAAMARDTLALADAIARPPGRSTAAAPQGSTHHIRDCA